MPKPFTPAEHKARHDELRGMLYELVEDFSDITGKSLSKTPVSVLIKWAEQQAKSPTGEEPEHA